MFDSQKLSFEKFVLNFKHGIYVLTSDACHICQDYKESISYINNANLYFVEVLTEQERDIVYEMTERSVLPLTVCYKDNKLKYVKAGQLFDTQLKCISVLMLLISSLFLFSSFIKNFNFGILTFPV